MNSWMNELIKMRKKSERKNSMGLT
jgi:hypothetical protein